MRFRTTVFVLLIAIFAAGARAQSSDIDIPFQKFVLDNGLTVIVHEDHKAPIVAINTWYHVGSKNEKPGKTGFAHLFEHLMFGGSEHSPGRYIDAMEKIGATDLNGTTNQRPHELLRKCSDVSAGLHAVDGVRPHGIPSRLAGPEDARFAARRGAERKAARREPALRGDAATASRRIPIRRGIPIHGPSLETWPIWTRRRWTT